MWSPAGALSSWDWFRLRTLNHRRGILKLTPLDIRKPDFRRTLRGFDPIEVQTFLDMVAENYDKLLEENKALNRRIIELETKLQDYQETEKTLRETLLNVQEVKKQSEESSRRQADLIIKEAELKAMEIMENARKQARQMREEVNWLKSQKESFINRLRHILISQIELLSVMEIDDAIPEEMQKLLKNARAKKLGGEATPELEAAISEGGAAAAEPSSPAAEPGITLEEEADKEAPSEAASSETTSQAKEKSESQEQNLTEEDINDLFKSGIQIDELIKSLNKKDEKK
ncbi:MAG: DivIVA domain-containing protein [Calditrichaeota bacterium]|nr:MAG: DivIVA domain-containing protein [Calditrichota bacterium]